MLSRFHLRARVTILAVVLAGLGIACAMAQPADEPPPRESPRDGGKQGGWPSGKTGKRGSRASRTRPDAEVPDGPGKPALPPAAEPQPGPAGPAVRPAPPAAARSPLGSMATAIQRALAVALAGQSPAPAPKADAKLRFQFRYQPWKDVLDWFAEQAGLSLEMSTPPPGTFNYSDDRQYTPAEAIDLLNSILSTKGYMLVRRGRMLMVINLEDGIPPNLVSTVPADALDTKGEYELVSTLFDLDKISPEEAEAEIKKLTGPQGSVVSLSKSRQVLVTETAGRLRAIRAVLARIQSPEGHPTGRVELVALRFATPEEVLPIVRQMLGIPEDKPGAADGSIRVAAEPGTNRIVASGSPDRVARVQEIVKALDVPGPGQSANSPAEGSPQLEVYAITGSDPQATLAILQTLLAGLPDVRLALDPKSGNLIALARLSQQATIRATLAQLQRDAQRVEVIRLAKVDPQTAVLAITKLFGAGDTGKTSAPQVDADPITRQLFVRGTEAQISQIRALLKEMGETGSAATTSAEKVRVLPLSGAGGRAALERLEEIWPTMRANRIRVVAPPPAAGPAETPPSVPGQSPEPQTKPAIPTVPPEKTAPPDPAQKPVPDPKIEAPPVPPQPGRSARRLERAETPDDRIGGPLPILADTPRLGGGARILLVAAGPSSGSAPLPDAGRPAGASPPAPPDVKAETPSKSPAADKAAPGASPAAAAEPPPIFIMPGPNGVVIASEDTAALDEFERLLEKLTAGAQSTGGGTTIFYLKYAKAAQMAETLDRIFAGGVSGPISPPPVQPSGPGAPRTDTSVLGTLLQGGGGSGRRVTGPIRITPDERLNALIVQANPADVDALDEMIRRLDVKQGPEEVAISPKPRMIPVAHKDAQEIAEIVREVYADRMVQSPQIEARRQGMMMNPLVQMYAGAMAQQMPQQGFRQGRRGGQADDQPKLAIAVDAKSNSLIVSAPDRLFEEVKQLVEELDVMASEQKESIRVVTLHETGSEAVRQALAAVAGSAVRFTTAAGAGRSQQGANVSDRPWMRQGGQGAGGAQSAFGGPRPPWQAAGFQPGQGTGGYGYGGRGRGGYGGGQGGGYGGPFQPGGGPGTMLFQPGGGPGTMLFQPGGGQFRQGGGGQFRGGAAAGAMGPGR